MKTRLTLSEKLKFERIGVVPNGFLNKDNEYEDIILSEEKI